jgi:hypothetical protein
MTILGDGARCQNSGRSTCDRDPTPINLDRTLDATATGVFRLDEKILVALDADRMLDFRQFAVDRRAVRRASAETLFRTVPNALTE